VLLFQTSNNQNRRFFDAEFFSNTQNQQFFDSYSFQIPRTGGSLIMSFSKYPESVGLCFRIFFPNARNHRWFFDFDFDFFQIPGTWQLCISEIKEQPPPPPPPPHCFKPYPQRLASLYPPSPPPHPFKTN
jgi:hypothetical protein